MDCHLSKVKCHLSHVTVSKVYKLLRIKAVCTDVSTDISKDVRTDIRTDIRTQFLKPLVGWPLLGLTKISFSALAA